MFILHPNQFFRDQVMVYGITIWFARRWHCNTPGEIHQFYDCQWINLYKWPISEFPSQTCALLLLSLHSVCHVTIAHCNDSNGTDTRVRVQCNDSDVTDRKQSRVCNDSTVTDISWAIPLHVTDIPTVDKVRFESPPKWNYPLKIEPGCICANATMSRAKK